MCPRHDKHGRTWKGPRPWILRRGVWGFQGKRGEWEGEGGKGDGRMEI